MIDLLEDLRAVRATLLAIDNVEAGAEAAEASGAEIAHPRLEFPGHGTFAIYIQGGVHHGLFK